MHAKRVRITDGTLGHKPYVRLLRQSRERRHVVAHLVRGGKARDKPVSHGRATPHQRTSLAIPGRRVLCALCGKRLGLFRSRATCPACPGEPWGEAVDHGDGLTASPSHCSTPATPSAPGEKTSPADRTSVCATPDAPSHRSHNCPARPRSWQKLRDHEIYR